MSGLPDDLLQARIVNAAGTLTRLSGARVSAVVAAAMAEAAQSSFDMWKLQAAASRRIAVATGAEAGIVTSGASAGLTLAAAAVLAGSDPRRLAMLPDRPQQHEILVPRTHRNGYDRAVKLAGAALVDIGTADRETGAGIRGLEAWEAEAAITPSTAGLLASGSAATEADIAVLAEVGRKAGLPLVVDAAAQLPPVANLRRFFDLGADLVVFSGGKAIGGPQASGILAGRRALIASAALQMLDMDVRPRSFEPPPEFFPDGAPASLPRHGVGRGFKASKEAIAGLLVALEAFRARDDAAEARALALRLEQLARAFAANNGLSCEILPGKRAGAAPRLALSVDRRACGLGAAELAALMRRHTPPVHVDEGQVGTDKIAIDLIACGADQDAHIVRAVEAALGSAGLRQG